MAKDSYVYFIGNGGHHVKIGVSSQPAQRLRDMQVASPFKLEMLLIIPGTRADERELHGLCSEEWVMGEWFRLTKELRDFIRWGLEETHPGPAAEAFGQWAEDEMLETWGGGAFQYREHERGY